MDPVADPSLIQTLSPYIDKALLGFIGLLLTGALELGRRHLGMAQTQVSQDAVNKAAASMTEAIMRKYGMDRLSSVTPSDPAVMEAADYVERRLPDSLKQLNMKTSDVRDLMTTRINAGLAHAKPAEATPVVPGPILAAPPPPLDIREPIPPEFPPLQKDDPTTKAQFVAALKEMLDRLESEPEPERNTE